MRLESLQPENESEFYACIRKLTLGDFYYERIEPSNESGFPDIYFVARGAALKTEGTIELKHCDSKLPNLCTAMKGPQKPALLDYYAAGGTRRFALCYAQGTAFLWNTYHFATSLRTGGAGWTTFCRLDDPRFREWLRRNLTQ